MSWVLTRFLTSNILCRIYSDNSRKIANACSSSQTDWLGITISSCLNCNLLFVSTSQGWFWWTRCWYKGDFVVFVRIFIWRGWRRRIWRGRLMTTCCAGFYYSYIRPKDIELWAFLGIWSLPGHSHSQGQDEAVESPQESKCSSVGDPVPGSWWHFREYLLYISYTHKYTDENCPIEDAPSVLFEIDQVSSVLANCCHATVGANSRDKSSNFEGH